MTAGMMREIGWQMDEAVNRDKTGEADGMNLEAASKYSTGNVKYGLDEHLTGHNFYRRQSDSPQ